MRALDVIEGRALWSAEQGEVPGCLRALPNDSVDLVMTSPPYEEARLYLEDGVNLGVSRDTDEWVAWMVEVCHELRRVCVGLCAIVVEGQTRDYRYSCSPFLLMAELYRVGFHLRKPPVFRRNGIPGSGGPDYWRNDWEPVVVFHRGGRLPWSDNTATGHPPKYGKGGEMSYRTLDGTRINKKRKINKPSSGYKNGDLSYRANVSDEVSIANPGNVINCIVGGGNMGSDLASDNEAPYPEDLVIPFVRCFCPPDGIVLDPFAGSGTTLAVARKWGRRAIGFDLRQSQVLLTQRRIREEATTMFDTIAEES